jgi:hypothetical protein
MIITTLNLSLPLNLTLDPYLVSIYPRDNILWVDGSDLEIVQRASDILMPPSLSNGEMVIGIDVEWRPFSTGSPPSPCSLLQIASRRLGLGLGLEEILVKVFYG